MKQDEFYKETSFKETPIGKIPKDWEIMNLGKIITYVKGKKPRKMTEEYQEGYLPYLSTEYLRDNKATNFMDPSQDVILVDDGDLILLWDGSNAGEFFEGKRGILSSTMVKIEQKEKKYDQKFLFYLLKTKENFLKSQTKGTGIPHVDKAVLNNIGIPYLSPLEQHKIAKVLSTVDEAIRRTNEVIAETERLKKGLMQTLLTRGIGHKEFKDTEIGRIPKEWEVARVGDVCEVIGGGTPSTKIKEYWDGNIPFVTPTDVTELENRNMNFLDQTKSYITEKGLKNSSTNLLPPGSVLLTSRATIGYCAINNVPVATNQGFANIICKERVHNLYILYLMKFMRKKLEELAAGSTYREISRTMVRNLRIPLPSILEQQKIAEILSTVDKKLEIEREEKAKLEKIKQGLMDLLLTGKIRVKVN